MRPTAIQAGLMAVFLVVSSLLSAPATAETRTAVFAGGCFWCVESDFDLIDGVVETVSGYAGGRTDNPTYQEVTYTDTGHYEVVRVRYDPGRVSYETLVDFFFRTVDPTDEGGQFCDRGASYRTAVFVGSDAERITAERAKAEAAETLGENIVTPIIDAAPFWTAENYHQDYHRRSALKYAYYRWGCGRDARVRELWGADAKEAAKAVNDPADDPS